MSAGPPDILTIYDRASSTLLDVREMDDYDNDEISLRTSLLEKYVRRLRPGARIDPVGSPEPCGNSD